MQNEDKELLTKPGFTHILNSANLDDVERKAGEERRFSTYPMQQSRFWSLLGWLKCFENTNNKINSIQCSVSDYLQSHTQCSNSDYLQSLWPTIAAIIGNIHCIEINVKK